MLKKGGFPLILAALCCLALTGCGERVTQETETAVTVYSFSGENDVMTLSNGVLVLTGTEQTLDGGDLDFHPAEPVEAVRYITKLYLLSGGERKTLISMGAQDTTGGALKVSGDVGGASGELLAEEDLAALEDGLWLELVLTDRSGAETTGTLELELTRVTGPEGAA